MEIKKLTAEHYDELLALLNDTFGNKYGKAMDFLSAQPKMWVRDDAHMGRHLGVFEDGKLCAVVGVYPLQTVIDGEKFLFATTGNVATHPEYEGRGYFNALFCEAMKELESMNADAARLGGARQRYGRFGYEGCGSSYLFGFGTKNRVAGFGENAGRDIAFSPITPDDREALTFCAALREQSSIYVARPAANLPDVYRSMCSKHNKPYLATRNGAPVGYVCCEDNGKCIGEFAAVNTETLGEMVCAWQMRNPDKHLEFAVPAYDFEALRLFCRTAESYRVTFPTRLKVRNWEKLINAMMRFAAKKRPLIDGEWTLGIEGYGALRLWAKDGKAGCERTDNTPELTLDPRAASRLLLGPDAPDAVTDLPPVPRSWLPLPFSWGALDAI